MAEAVQQAEGDAAVPDHREVQDRQQRRSGRLSGRWTTSRIHHLLAWSAPGPRQRRQAERVRRLRVMRAQPPPAGEGDGSPLPCGRGWGRRPTITRGRPAPTPPRRRSARTARMPGLRAHLRQHAPAARAFAAGRRADRRDRLVRVRLDPYIRDDRDLGPLSADQQRLAAPHSAAASPPPAATIRACWPAAPPRSAR